MRRRILRTTISVLGLLFPVAFPGCLGSGGSSPSAGAWGTPERISGGSFYSHYPSVLSDSAGNAVVVWAMGALNNPDIYTNRYSTIGGRWGSPQKLSTSSPNGAWEPDLAEDSSGNIVAVWYQMDGVAVNVYASRYTPTGGWDNTPTLLDTGDEDAYFAQVASDPAGNIFAIWQQAVGPPGSRTGIWTRRFDAASGIWEPPVEISDGGGGDSLLPGMPGRGNCIQADGSGNVLAVWVQRDGSSVPHIWARRYDAVGKSWGSPVRVDSDSGNADSPAFVLDGTGDAVAVWRQFDGSSFFAVWVNRFDGSTTSWGTPVPIDNASGTVASPQVASDGNGNLLAVWQRYTPPALSVWASRYRTGSGWEPAIRMDSIDTTDAYYPYPVFDSAGNGMVAWNQAEGGRSKIWIRKFVPGQDWGSAETIPISGTGDTWEPSGSADGNGKVVFVYLQDDPSDNRDVWGVFSR